MIEQKLSATEVSSPASQKVYEASKRVADVAISAVLLILSAPIMAFVSLWVLVDSRGPIFFMQNRVGKNGKLFRIIKFRSMVADAEFNGPQVTSKNDPRTTRSGRVIRAWKLDEFPQLVNVFKGDMSLVGPRPQVPKYVDLFPARQREKILGVRPGITGPTAIRFRHEEEMLQKTDNREEYYIAILLPIKCDLDEAYIDSRGWKTDLSAFFETLTMLLHGVVNRLRGIPVGETVEYPLPEVDPARFSAYAVVQSESLESDPALANVSGQ